MVKKVANRRSHLKQLGFWLIMIIELLLLHPISSQKIPARKILNDDSISNSSHFAVQLKTSHPESDSVVVDNGLVEVTIENPSGYLLGIKYQGIDNVLEERNEHSDRGYWDLVWYNNTTYDKMETEYFDIITQTDDLVELSFSRTWNPDNPNLVPLNIDKRFIVHRGVPGVYMYAILERQENFPSTEMFQIRIAFKLLGKK
ncbi:Rhamnogalacturonate lyase [Corchorus capsularis]|uniref:Rhamnogalacturonate lyase n=1 Tax=Corchorus capsularis TaxID=210143 RepID=A0A1R3GDY9_COCAP|nr:Rhamnogalacturonate lyase [Corchorus capsularis]